MELFQQKQEVMQSLANLDLKDRHENFVKLDEKMIKVLIHQLGKGWKLREFKHIEKEFHFHTYMEGLDFANRVAKLSEEVNHHADIYIGYKQVKLMIWTHNIKGLSKADFVLAARIEMNTLIG